MDKWWSVPQLAASSIGDSRYVPPFGLSKDDCGRRGSYFCLKYNSHDSGNLGRTLVLFARYCSD